jgi:hypothetical protein
VINLQVHYLAVLVSGVLIFMLGGLWYSPLLFANRWMALMGKSREDLAGSASPFNYVLVLVCGLLTAFGLAVLLGMIPDATATTGAGMGFLCWLAFAGATSFGSNLFSGRPTGLWLINSGYNLISFVLAGIVLAVWK